MIIVDKTALKLNEDGSVPSEVLLKLIKRHRDSLDRLRKLEEYYDGDQEILNRRMSTEDLPNNQLVANHAKYISDMATAYVFGEPIQYSGEGADVVDDIFTKAEEDGHNAEMGLDLSVFGRAFELVYMSDDDKPTEKLARISPYDGFVVCDTDIDKSPVFGVLYMDRRDIDDRNLGLDIHVYTEDRIYSYMTESERPDVIIEKEAPEEHFFGGVPLIEYRNNSKEKGDFEGVITLIDAYNKLQSDRINDKEQQVDAILAVTGASFGDTEQEKITTAMLLKKLKVLELDEGCSAEWLTKSLTEADVEILKDGIKNDIHEFSMVPCLTDENFANNASGVAMKYKLLGFEDLAQTKERYFKKGLRERLRLIANVENTRAVILDPEKIDITMKRALPVDEAELSQIAQNTAGFLSWETRVKRFDAEIDLESEKERLDAEKAAEREAQKELYSMGEFTQAALVEAEDKE